MKGLIPLCNIIVIVRGTFNNAVLILGSSAVEVEVNLQKEVRMLRLFRADTFPHSSPQRNQPCIFLLTKERSVGSARTVNQVFTGRRSQEFLFLFLCYPDQLF